MLQNLECSVIDVNYFCRLATIILAGPECGRGCDWPAAGWSDDGSLPSFFRGLGLLFFLL